MATVLIASTSIDEPTYGRVAEKLGKLGHEVVLYLADRIVSGRDHLALDVGTRGALEFWYNRVRYDFSRLPAAWYRHPDLFGYNETDKAKQLCLEFEAQQLQEAFWRLVPESSWLNSPARIRRAQVKVNLLLLAATLGFQVPHTVVSNDWEEVMLRLSGRTVAIKMSRGLLYEDGIPKTLYTTVLDANQLATVVAASSSFPAIIQDYIPKAREWRVTVVGERIFSASIYTTVDTKDDWRKYQFTNAVQFRGESVPGYIGERCIALLHHLGLRYGAFDFVEDPDGRIIFLELNPNGQFMWLENKLGFPISSAIAEELADIAKRNLVAVSCDA